MTTEVQNLDSVLDAVLGVSVKEIDERIEAIDQQMAELKSKQGKLRELRKIAEVHTARAPRKRGGGKKKKDQTEQVTLPFAPAEAPVTGNETAEVIAGSVT